MCADDDYFNHIQHTRQQLKALHIRMRCRINIVNPGPIATNLVPFTTARGMSGSLSDVPAFVNGQRRTPKLLKNMKKFDLRFEFRNPAPHLPIILRPVSSGVGKLILLLHETSHHTPATSDRRLAVYTLDNKPLEQR